VFPVFMLSCHSCLQAQGSLPQAFLSSSSRSSRRRSFSWPSCTCCSAGSPSSILQHSRCSCSTIPSILRSERRVLSSAVEALQQENKELHAAKAMLEDRVLQLQQQILDCEAELAQLQNALLPWKPQSRSSSPRPSS